ncbi:XRE family transcriptional regulator [Paenibacillus riograndensis]|uniref:XRE family transcriptional regulator n=1 Tax=Paenibacillus riograndensis TaxID=483937 RepID=A0A132UAW2_9BACL|nr:helix-turn-helix transcriptional regulator [Paenibacillus riograndensis]KWX80516.1 XRE family transcriptional regulator [Paenibacillus riograndensis]
MISYKPFQKLLIDKEIKKMDLKKQAGISAATMAKLNTNEYVSLEVIDKLCAVLECQPGDLMEYIPENK